VGALPLCAWRILFLCGTLTNHFPKERLRLA